MQEQDKRKKRKLWKWLLLLLLLIAIVTGVLYKLGYIWMPWEKAAMITGSGKEGDLSQKSDRDIMAELQKKVDESMVSFKINGRPEFEDSKSEGNLYIANPSDNKYNIIVEIYLDSTREKIYESGMLTPNHYIDYDKLNAELSAGVHEATAYINFYENEEYVNQVSVSQEITINN